MFFRNFACSNIPERIKERDVFDEFETQINLHSLLITKRFCNKPSQKIVCYNGLAKPTSKFSALSLRLYSNFS